MREAFRILMLRFLDDIKEKRPKIEKPPNVTEIILYILRPGEIEEKKSENLQKWKNEFENSICKLDIEKNDNYINVLTPKEVELRKEYK